MGCLVREKPNHEPAAGSLSLVFGNSRIFPEFLLALDIFGLGDFSPTLLILFATQVFDSLIRESVAGIAVGLYTPYLPRESLRE